CHQLSVINSYLGISFLLGVDTLSVHQSPPFLSVLRGTHLKLSCFITGDSNPDIYWYRQSPHTGPQLLFYSTGTDHVDPTRLGQFTASRPNSSHFFLESTAVAANDSAVYYCAGRTHSDSNTDTLCTKTTPALSPSHCPVCL
ncbi:UNVERIFIED_CONTAM: hypothetical protein FKN15_062052, partial [Acipenser sinensis]